MTRRLTPTPNNVSVVKTTRGSWIAFREIWKGNRLIDIHPMREIGASEVQCIMQKHERREMLNEVERALLATQLEEARRELEALKQPKQTPRDAPSRAG